jgi:hypothetical protein
LSNFNCHRQHVKAPAGKRDVILDISFQTYKKVPLQAHFELNLFPTCLGSQGMEIFFGFVLSRVHPSFTCVIP